MARFYADENVPAPVIVELQRLGHDVLTMQESGHAGRAVPDVEVLRFATANERAVEDPRHAGIVVCTFDVDFTALARRIHDAVQVAPTLAGQVLRVNRPPLSTGAP